MRNQLLAAVIAVTACKPSAKQETPAAGSGSAKTPAAPLAAAVVDAGAPEPGPSDELRKLLVPGGPTVPPLPADVTARFAVDVADEETADKTAWASSGRVLVYRVAGGKVELEATVEKPRDCIVADMAWKDGSELVLLIGKHTDTHFDFSFKRVGNGKVADVAWPDKKLVKATKAPANTRNYDRLVATASGEVWMNKCRVHEERDPHNCTDHVSVRIAPPATAAGAPGPLRAPIAALGPAPGWSMTFKPLAGRRTGDFACTGTGGIAATIELGEERSFGFRPSTRWLSHHPPIQYVEEEIGDVVTPNELGRVDHDFIRDCKRVDTVVDLMEPGPAGLWAVFDGHAVNTKRGAAFVLWHGHIVAAIRGAERIAFAP